MGGQVGYAEVLEECVPAPPHVELRLVASNTLIDLTVALKSALVVVRRSSLLSIQF